MPIKDVEKRRAYFRKWYAENRAKKPLKPKKIKIECLECKGLFMPKNKRQKYCTRECFYASMIGRKGPLGYKHTGETKKRMSESALKNGRGKYNLGYKHTGKMKERTRLSKLGSKNPNWRGGITPENTVLRRQPAYKKWRDEIFKRDNYTCQNCGIRNEKGLGHTIALNAHHIKPFSLYPELREVVSNGLTLYIDCHNLTKQGRGTSKNMYKAEN